MKSNVKELLSITVLVASFATGFAQTNYFIEAGAVSGKYPLGIASNWSEGVLPTVTAGYITNGWGRIGSTTGDTNLRIEDLIIVQEGGYVGNQSDSGGGTMINCDYTINGGTLGGKGFTLNSNTTITVNGGVVGNSGRAWNINSGSSVTVNGGRFGPNDLAAKGAPIVINDGIWIVGSFFGWANLTINGGVHTNTGGFGSSGHNGYSGTVYINGGTFTGGRSVWRSTSKKYVFGGSAPGTMTFNDWGNGLYTSSGDRNDDRGTELDFLSNTLVTFSMIAPRALDFTNDSTDNPVYGSNEWAKALWETGRLLFHGRSKTDLGGSPTYDWDNATNWNGLDGYFCWSFDGTNLALAYEPPAAATVIIIE
ncbi:hypothetical protein BVX97_05680 [bacterium E08(2017)]|nr:hypothetical protein BVX97_05680 [bacterium E08(2017)]